MEASGNVNEPEAAPDTVQYGDSNNSTYILQVKMLTKNGTIPAQAASDSAGYDVYSAVDIKIHQTQLKCRWISPRCHQKVHIVNCYLAADGG
jgi:hypothetical protein